MSTGGTMSIEAAWLAYRAEVDDLRARMLASPLAARADDRARAYHWLLQAEAAAFNLAIAPQPSHPRFFVNTVFEPNLYTWLLPNADFLYRYAFLDPARRFRISGTRGSTRFLEAQTIRGFWGDPDLKLLKTYDFDRFERAEDGGLTIEVGPTPPGDQANWIATDPTGPVTTLIIREAFWDWQREERSTLAIAAIDDVAPPPAFDPGALRARIAAAARMIRFCYGTFSGGLTEDVLEKVGTNRFLLVDTSKDEHASNPSAGYVPAVYDLGPDEALIVEVVPPKARYWNLHLGDVWWQVTDYTHHQSSLNGHQAVADGDGKVRIVISARDPGVANWLDVAGNLKGVALLRWYFADAYPAPAARKVAFSDLAAALPAATVRVKPESRAQAVARRTRAVLQRYGH